MGKGKSEKIRHFVDGTKIESASGWYTFVWKKELKVIEKEYLPRKKKYEKAKRICGI